MDFWSGFEKRSEASKEDLKKVLAKHEERETPEQEAAESKEEQKVEREAGVEKGAQLLKAFNAIWDPVFAKLRTYNG